ncbi:MULTISPECIES: hypothetical protein [unclassified Streptomyces]|uniref:hypothetical protein n=1 Tax=unclassified Streptomyces TaxID=2593676 RepID=UPI001660872D|nr:MULTISPECIES: hypothetical protein [unclassified Streptomyces]MBD0709650.1 hypothetical protein [Streptomyces sp. CBMA291]MBD0713965.1 hypothetical protein [Streptomyces sp. CBMA370]MBD0715226.1 hypothetical protein [Streptomyces sp. CBMA370]
MQAEEAVWEDGVLSGGPADGVRVRVARRPDIVQVTYPCELPDGEHGLRVDALFVYRRDGRTQGGLRYGFDPASP